MALELRFAGANRHLRLERPDRQLCVRVENFHRPCVQAFQHCANPDLRLPTLGEAIALGRARQA